MTDEKNDGSVQISATITDKEYKCCLESMRRESEAFSRYVSSTFSNAAKSVAALAAA